MPEATHSVVPYQTPHARAFAAAQSTALGFTAAVLVIVIPLIRDYLNKGIFSKGETITLLTTIGSGALGVLGTYVVKYIAAHGNDAPPTVDAFGATPGAPVLSAILPEQNFTSLQGMSAIAHPIPELPGVNIDPYVVTRLVERNLTDYLDHLDRHDMPPTQNMVEWGTVGMEHTPSHTPVTANPHGVGVFSTDDPLTVTTEPVVGKRKRVIPTPEA